ncbi:MAG: O-antigen ligase family protein [Chlamydiia bacterium]|nr:O-antigen ligase family protein [Chlamydiia bacterium]
MYAASLRTFFWALLITLLVTRGILEAALAKKAAMIAQFGILVPAIALLSLERRVLFSAKQKRLLLFALLFVCSALLSCALTYWLTGSTVWIVYLSFNLGLVLLALLLIRDFPPSELAPKLIPFIRALGWLLLAAAMLEQLRILKVVGSGEMYVIRPASLTGSFLHYPLVMNLFGLVLMQHWQSERSLFSLFSGVVFNLAPFAAASRSGMLLAAATLFLYPFVNRFQRSRGILLLLGVIVAASLMLFTLGSKETSKNKVVNLVHRLVTAAQSKAAGNEIRIRTWKQVTARWLKTNLLLGEEAGVITNSTNNLAREKRGKTKGLYNVSESSPLQLLSNFGLLGLIGFYGILFQIPRFMDRSHCWLHAGFWGALVQTLVYQSIEVVPFIGLLLLFPFFSQTLLKRDNRIFSLATN